MNDEKPILEDEFQVELTRLLNKHCIENESDTPDYILARYMRACLYSYSAAVRQRDSCFGFAPWAGLKETKA